MKDGVIIYISHFKSVEMLPDSDLGALFRAVFVFAIGGTPQVPSHLQIAFNFITSQISRDEVKYNEICEKRRESGRLGGQAKRKGKKNDEEPKPKKTREQLDKELEERKKKFEKSLVPFMVGYGGIYQKEMLREFADYWTEFNKSRTKMRWELCPTWVLELRLKTWANREKGKPQAASSQPKNGKKTPEQALKEFAEKLATGQTTEDAEFQIIKDNE